MPFINRPANILATLVLAWTAPSTEAAVFDWPGASPCQTTLQACINGVSPGDVVRIGAAQGTPGYRQVGESLVINKSMRLTAVPGVDAVFAADAEISVDVAGTSTFDVEIDHLVFERGRVLAPHATTAAGSYRFHHLRFNDVKTDAIEQSTIHLFLQNAIPGSGTVSAIISDNIVNISGTAEFPRDGVLISQVSGGPTLNARIERNRVVSHVPFKKLRAGISLHCRAGANVLVAGNYVSATPGNGFLQGIDFTAGLEPSSGRIVKIISNVVANGQGVDDAFDDFGIAAYMTGGELRIANNTVVHGEQGIRIFNNGPVELTGALVNNIIAFNAVRGIYANTTFDNGYNLVYGNGPDYFEAPGAFVYGSSTYNFDPGFESATYPAPAAITSAIIETGLNAGATDYVWDVLGEKRIAGNPGSGATVDLGAIETSGDVAYSQTANPANLAGNGMRVFEDPELPLRGEDETLIATPVRQVNLPATEAIQNLGVVALPGATAQPYWMIQYQNPRSTMSDGRTFNILSPFPASLLAGSKTGFKHTALPPGTSEASVIDHPSMNGLANIIAIAMARRETEYHDHPIGLTYDAALLGGRWKVVNQDRQVLTQNRMFNVVAAALGSPNAFSATVGANPSATLRIDHPLVDNNPCAIIVVGRVGGSAEPHNPVAFSLDYRNGAYPGQPGHWYVVAEGGQFPANARFNVIVDGIKSSRCLASSLEAQLPGPLFSDGFE